MANKKRKRSSSPENNNTTLSKISCRLKKIDNPENICGLEGFSNKKTKDLTSKKKTSKSYSLEEPHAGRSKKDSNRNNCLGYELKGGNLINVVSNLQMGLYKSSVLQEIAEQVYSRNLKGFKNVWSFDTTDLRITSMQWHPVNTHLFVTGGKAGTMALYSINQNPKRCVQQVKDFPGVGPGGTMEAIRFNTKISGIEVCTASVDGTISSYNFEKEIKTTLVVTEDPFRKWFCAVDIHEDGKSVYGGDSKGNLAVHHLDSGKTEYSHKNLRIHTAKIRHLEFSRRDSNIMATSALDHTVKLWDVRKLDGKGSCIESLEHDCSVSTATFSQTDGCRLLTTDMYSQVRVYKAPLWTLEHNITHPHRPFQHLTTVRASWHPRADLFVVGRYPDPMTPNLGGLDNIRSVDVFSASSGKLCHELTDTSRFITSLCQFNASGTVLASACGKTFFLWKLLEQRISSP